MPCREITLKSGGIIFIMEMEKKGFLVQTTVRWPVLQGCVALDIRSNHTPSGSLSISKGGTLVMVVWAFGRSSAKGAAVNRSPQPGGCGCWVGVAGSAARE